jgi:Flp pilus assembly protein TadD
VENPQDRPLAELLAELGLYATKQGDFARAQVLLDGLQELRPAEPHVDILRGLLAFGREDFAASEKAYREALGKDGESDLGRAFLAEALIPQKRFREAEQLLGQVMSSERDPSAVAFARSLHEALRQGVFTRS